jgi:hypothetical protein
LSVRRKSAIVGLISIGLMGLAAQPARAAASPTLVRIIDASSWGSPVIPAPDPMGLTYDSQHNRLIITDSEVEEKVTQSGTTYMPAYWHGANVFEFTLGGTMTRTTNIATVTDQLDPADATGHTFLPNTNGFTDEAADIAYNPTGNGTLYVVDDDRDLVTTIPLGSNGILDATDGPRTSFTTRDMTGDPEGIGFGLVSGTPTLFISAGEGPLPKPETNWAANQHRIHEIYRLQPGPNGVFDGPAVPAGVDPVNWDSNGDDIMFHFDTCNPSDPLVPSSPCTSPINQHDPEDVAYDPISGNLFMGSRDVPTDPNAPSSGNTVVVTETTVNGAMVDSYNLGDIKGLRVSGIAVAPASGNASERSLYVADRGADNNSDRLKNDGRIFEFQLGGVVNRGPIVTSPGNQTSDEGAAVSLQIDAVDTEGDPVSCSATGLPLGLSISSSCLISGTVTFGAGAGNPHTTKVTATDTVHNLANSATFTWTINDITPPAVPSALIVLRDTTGAVHLDWQDSTEADLAGYDVSRSASASGPWTKLNTTPVPASEYTDATAPVGTVFYQIEALDNSSNRSGPIIPVSGASGKISYVGQTKAKGSGSTMKIRKPAGVQTGDVLLAAFTLRGTDTILPPAGWTLVSQVTRSSSLVHQGIYSHTVAGTGEPASYTFGFVGRTSAVAMIMAYRGAIALPQLTAGQANPAGTSIGAPAVTPTLNNSVQIAFFGIASETSIAGPAGMFEKGEHIMSSGSLRLTMEVSDVIVNAVPIGSRIATAADEAENIGQVIVLSPKL